MYNLHCLCAGQQLSVWIAKHTVAAVTCLERGHAKPHTCFYRHHFRSSMLSDGQLAVGLAHSQQAAVRGYAQGQYRARVLGGVGHLEGVQVIHLCGGELCFECKWIHLASG